MQSKERRAKQLSKVRNMIMDSKYWNTSAISIYPYKRNTAVSIRLDKRNILYIYASTRDISGVVLHTLKHSEFTEEMLTPEFIDSLLVIKTLS